MPVTHSNNERFAHKATAAIFLGFALAATPILSGCQQPDDQSQQGGDSQQNGQNTKSQASNEGGETSSAGSGGGSGSGSDTGGSGSSSTTTTKDGSDEGNGEPTPSTKTTFDDLWMVDSVSLDDATFTADDILGYELHYETVCFFELYNTDGKRTFQANVPGFEVTGDWEETGDSQVTLHIATQNNRPGDLVATMTDGYQKLSVEGVLGGVKFKASMHRDDDTSFSVSDIIATAIDANKIIFDALPIDAPLDIPFADDPSVRMRVIGTTHSDDMGTMGYLIEATNKTDSLIVANDLVNSAFMVHGTQVTPQYARVLPPASDGSVAPVRIYLAFDRGAIGGNLSDVHGEIMLTDYDWNEKGRYAFNL